MIETKTCELIVTSVKIVNYTKNKGTIVSVTAGKGSTEVAFDETAEKAPRVLDVVRVTMEWGDGE